MSSDDAGQMLTDDGPSASQEAAAPAAPVTLPPLAVSALMLTKADLIAALRVYLPHLTDVEVIDDGERFLLKVGPHQPPAGENGAS